MAWGFLKHSNNLMSTDKHNDQTNQYIGNELIHKYYAGEHNLMAFFYVCFHPVIGLFFVISTI